MVKQQLLLHLCIMYIKYGFVYNSIYNVILYLICYLEFLYSKYNILLKITLWNFKYDSVSCVKFFREKV